MKSRGNGTGTIVWREKEARFAVQVTSSPGKRTTRYAKTKEDAEVVLEELTLLRQQGYLSADSRQSVAQFLACWLEDSVQHRVRPHAFWMYKSRMRHVTEHIGAIRLSDLKPTHLRRCYGNLLNGGLSGTSVNMIHVIFKSALKQAVEEKIIPENPAASVRAPRKDQREMEVLSADELDRLLANTEGDDWHGLWTVLGTTGLRLGEALALRWTDVKNGSASITRSVTQVEGVGLVFGELKNNSSRRTVKLGVTAQHALDRHRIIQVQHRLSAQQWHDLDLVFPDTQGRPRWSSQVGKALRRSLTEAGLKRIRVHDLRHTAATVLLAGGEYINVVQQMLGHRDIGTTLRMYAHVSPAMHQVAADRMDELLASARRKRA